MRRLGGLGRKRVPITCNDGMLRIEWPDKTFSTAAQCKLPAPVYAEVRDIREIASNATVVAEEVPVLVVKDRIRIAEAKSISKLPSLRYNKGPMGDGLPTIC